MMQKSTEIKIRKPDDWHLHLRDGDALKVTVPNACRGFNRGIIMPNLVPPVTSVDLAHEYRKRIIAKTFLKIHHGSLSWCFF